MNVFTFGSLGIAVDDDCRLIDIAVCSADHKPLLASKGPSDFEKRRAQEKAYAERHKEQRRASAREAMREKRKRRRKPKGPRWRGRAAFQEALKALHK